MNESFIALPFIEAFPRLLEREHRDAITTFALHVGALMQAQGCPYEALDSTAAMRRDAKRRGAGWLPKQTDIGWSNRMEWDEGFHLLLSVTPHGVITGFGFGSASSLSERKPKALSTAISTLKVGQPSFTFGPKTTLQWVKFRQKSFSPTNC